MQCGNAEIYVMGWDGMGGKCFGFLYCSEVRCGMTWCNAA